jgi:hypothetical protein
MKERPVVRTPRTAEVAPAPKETRRPPPERPRRFVRWIEYAAIVLILGAAAVIGVLMLRGGGEEIAYDTVDRHELAEAAKARAQVGAVSVGPFDSHELAELAKLRATAEGVGSATLPITPASYASHVGLREAGALAIVPGSPASYGIPLAALQDAGALAIVPVTPASYTSHAALREAGALAIVPVTPASYASHAALREAGALAIVPVTPASYTSHAALREAGAPFELPG